MKLEIFGSRILILCDDMVEKVGTIIMPGKHSERSRTATVVAVGNGISKKKTKWWHFRIRNFWFGGTPIFKPGDKILISWYTGVHMHLPGQDLFGTPVDEDRHRFVMESEILGKIVE